MLQSDLNNKISEKQTVLSIMAGISTEKLCNSLNIANSVRIMPNTPSQLGKGISVWFSKNSINSENSRIVSFLIYGIFIGRLYEKIKKFKKNIRLKK